MSTLIVSAEIHHTHIPEAKLLDVFGEKSLKSSPPCYSQSSLLTNLLPPPLLEQKWFETGLYLNIVYRDKSENSQDYVLKLLRS